MKRTIRNFKEYPFTSLLLLSLCLFGIYNGIHFVGAKQALAKNKEVNLQKEIYMEQQKSKAEKGNANNKEVISAKNTSTEKTEKKNQDVLGKVGKHYLDGALFIGDSRTATLAEYAGWKKTDFYVEYGMTIWTVMDSKLAKDKKTGQKISVRKGLEQSSYKKIYLMLGINELGRGTAETYASQYKSVIKTIRKMQPDAIIYVQSIMHVTNAKDKEHTYINNKEINRRNKQLKKMENPDKKIYYLDINQVYDNPETNKMSGKYTTDGVHIKPQYLNMWKKYLLNHGIKIMED